MHGMRRARAATDWAYELCDTATSIPRPRPNRASAAARPATARAFARRPRGARAPITRTSGQRSLASATVCAWSRAVSTASVPRARSSSTIGSNRIGCGELDRSIQTRTEPLRVPFVSFMKRVSDRGAPSWLRTPAAETPKLTRRRMGRQTRETNEVPLHLVRGNRFVPAAAERAFNAALSRGPGYEPTPIGPNFDERSVRGYYVDFRAKTTSAAASDVS